MKNKKSNVQEKAIKGIQSFNNADFYTAHEYFEDAWRETPNSTREFYRALLHLSGGFYRLTQNRPDAALKFFQRALHWIEMFPSPYLGVNTSAIKTQIKFLLTAIESGQPGPAILEKYIFHLTYFDEATTE